MYKAVWQALNPHRPLCHRLKSIFLTVISKIDFSIPCPSNFLFFFVTYLSKNNNLFKIVYFSLYIYNRYFGPSYIWRNASQCPAVIRENRLSEACHQFENSARRCADASVGFMPPLEGSCSYKEPLELSTTVHPYFHCPLY